MQSAAELKLDAVSCHYGDVRAVDDVTLAVPPGSYVVLNLPLAFVVVYGQFDRDQVRLEQAARDLGASELQVFLRVTVPLLRTAIVAAFLLSLTFSWDEFIVSFLLSGFDPTLPVVIWGMLRSGLNPQTNAVGTLVFTVSLVAAVLFEWAVLRQAGKGRDAIRR